MNTIDALFQEAKHSSITNDALWQGDTGQTLVLYGPRLFGSFEAHFCNAGDSITTAVTGQNLCVAIPDEYLVNGRNINAYIYLQNEANDGRTEYSVTIRVKMRP